MIATLFASADRSGSAPFVFFSSTNACLAAANASARCAGVSTDSGPSWV
jgi:hypothetical protein